MPGTTTPATIFGPPTATLSERPGWAGLAKPSTRNPSPGGSKSASISPSRLAPRFSPSPSATPTRALLTDGRGLETWPSPANEDDLIRPDKSASILRELPPEQEVLLGAIVVTTNSPRNHRVNQPGLMLCRVSRRPEPCDVGGGSGSSADYVQRLPGLPRTRMPSELNDTGAADHGGVDPSA